MKVEEGIKKVIQDLMFIEETTGEDATKAIAEMDQLLRTLPKEKLQEELPE